MAQFSKTTFEYFSRNLTKRDMEVYCQAIRYLELIFQKHELQEVKELARNYQLTIEKISPFIENATQRVCPSCKDVCCINKHGYYNFEDLVYFHAIGLKSPLYQSGGEDSEQCRFLTSNGCSIKRSLRPSGCNWYFCDPLLEYIEKLPEYQQFDDSMRDLAEIWMMMIEEFSDL
jgi:hypothetical protein